MAQSDALLNDNRELEETKQSAVKPPKQIKVLLDDQKQPNNSQFKPPLSKKRDRMSSIHTVATDDLRSPIQSQYSSKSSMSIEDADNLFKMMKLHGPKMICLWITLFIVDTCLLISTSLYLVRHDNVIHERLNISYRSIGDIFTSVYRLLVIYLCIRFMKELLQGTVTKQQAQEFEDEELLALSNNPRTALSYNLCKKVTYFFERFELNQFTIAAVLCATHQMYNAALLWMAVCNGANKWYIVTGFAYFLGTFSIALPGICFNQFEIYKKKQNKVGLKSEFDFDENSTMITSKSKLIAIKVTIFSDPVVQFLLFVGFLTELLQFCCIPSLNHADVIIMQNIIYHCENTGCDKRPDFVLSELVFRLFVGMALFNNLVLLGSVLSDQLHSETSLTNITKIFNPICYMFLLLALLMDLRVTDDYWVIEYHVVNWFWMAVHIFGIVIILKLLCCHLYQLNHYINHGKNKNRTIKATTSLFVEALILTVLAFLSTLFISFDQKLFADFWRHSNLRIWRQWIVVVYHLWQIPLLWCANRIQQFDSFVTKLGKASDYKGMRACFIWIAFINLYDFMYSFMFEAREYDQVMNGDEIDSDDHSDIDLYKWSYSLSFTVSHLILWSLCCSIEFIMKYDQTVNKNKQKKQGHAQYQNNQVQRKLSQKSQNDAFNANNRHDVNLQESLSASRNRSKYVRHLSVPAQQSQPK